MYVCCHDHQLSATLLSKLGRVLTMTDFSDVSALSHISFFCLQDLAQLLRSLYDAVGSSISLPQTGAKSLKLKLTVSPDHSKQLTTVPLCNGKAAVATAAVKSANNHTSLGNTHSNNHATSGNSHSNNHHTQSKRKSRHVRDSRDRTAAGDSNCKENIEQPRHGSSKHKNKDSTKAVNSNAIKCDANGNTTTVVSPSSSKSPPGQNNLSCSVPSGQSGNGVIAGNNIQCSRIPENGIVGEADLQMTSTEKKQLVELVQRNMEKHQQRQQLRKIR